MKKLLLLTALGAIATMPAVAVQKCIYKQDMSSSCTHHQSLGFSEWNLLCTGRDSEYVTGIGVCAYNDGSPYEISDELSFSSQYPNTHCWCRMLKPAVSNWVYLKNFSSTDECLYNCSDACGQDAVSGYEMSDAIFWLSF